MNPEHDAWLQDLVCGDRRVDDPDVRARLAADPALRAEIAALFAAQQQIDQLGGESAAEAGQPAAADRAAVAAALFPRRRWRTAGITWFAAIAAALILGCQLWPRQRPAIAADGPLGSDGALRVLRDGHGYRVEIREILPPDVSYHLRLELADGTVRTASTDTSTWYFPIEWQDATARPGSHRLVVEASDTNGFAFRRVHELR